MKVIVIGGGFSGLAAACHLAHSGCNVTVLERHAECGGRARVLSSGGFSFDMGPSWYWMPDIFEDFFGTFGKKVSDYYTLVRLDPSYQIITKVGDIIDIPAYLEAFLSWAESRQEGVSNRLKSFFDEGKFKYFRGMYEYTRRPCNSLFEFLDATLIKESLRLQMFRSMRSHINTFVSDPILREVLEFPVLFLGAPAYRTPAMYSLMNYADVVLGTWYPIGGMGVVVKSIVSLALELGVKIENSCEVKKIIVNKAGTATEVRCSDDKAFYPDKIICAADYHHCETTFLESEWQSYSPKYWRRRVMAPSCVLFYLGCSNKIKGIRHHTLVFDQDLDEHSRLIYDQPEWPAKPLFYVCTPSVTDSLVAPKDSENIFILVPVATALAESDSDEKREYYRNYTISKLENYFHQSIKDSIVFERSYAHRDFIADYGALSGNAYGLANTLLQTASLKPKIRSKRVKNLFYCGQLTVPGPGVPPSLISGAVVAKEVIKSIS